MAAPWSPRPELCGGDKRHFRPPAFEASAMIICRALVREWVGVNASVAK